MVSRTFTNKPCASHAQKVLHIWDAHKSEVSYNPDTGHFYRLVPRGKWKPGQFHPAANGSGHLQIKLGGLLILAHRLAWLASHGALPDCEIDHINGNKRDNRLCNLRLATRAQNSANVTPRRGTAAGLKGATPHGRRWKAQICCHGRKEHLGIYDTAEEAGRAYAVRARELFGEFARLT